MSNRVVVITGASAGIGAALAKALAKKGDRLVLAARREDALAEVAKACGPETLVVKCDVTKRGDVERLRDEAIRKFGHVDAWVNNAGRGITRHVLELTDADVDEMVATNLKSAIYGMQAIVPHFQQRGSGVLVNVSSNLGKIPVVTFRSAYSAMKAALNSLTANLRMDLARTHPGVKVSTVLPGPVATDFHQNALGGVPAAAGTGMPYQTPEEVAEVIAKVLDDPKPEVFTTPQLEAFAKKYQQDIAGFEAGARVARLKFSRFAREGAPPRPSRAARAAGRRLPR